jgi:hypothetical protein
MTISATSPVLAEDGSPGADLVTGLIDVATWYAVHTGASLPVPHLNVPVPPGAPGARLAALDEIAGHLGVDVAERDGMLVAERRFGPVVVEAHLALRAPSRHARPAGTGATA